VSALYAACPAPVLPLVVFLANTGCRRGEALALRWEGVDLERGLVRFWPSRFWQPKNNSPREVPISTALRPWLEGARRSTHVFPSRLIDEETGIRRPYATWPQKQFETARDAAGLSGGPHKLRHTFASHFLAARPDLPLLAEILGHSSTYVTEIYAHMLPGHLERARDAVSMPAPAEALAMHRWRLDRAVKAKTVRKPSGANAAVSVTSERETGFEPATFSLGSGEGRAALLKLLKK
jgi:integrase